MEIGDADCEASDGDDGRPTTATTTATVIAKVATRNKKEGLLRRKPRIVRRIRRISRMRMRKMRRNGKSRGIDPNLISFRLFQ
jgi:hypothetical protein